TATPASRVQVRRQANQPTSRATANVHRHTPRELPVRKDSNTPTAEAAVVWIPVDRERYTVACTVSSGVQGARNGSSDSRMLSANHQAAVAATTHLRICSRSLMNSGRRTDSLTRLRRL